MVKEGMVLETARLRMERITATDAEEWWEAIWSDVDVTRYLPPQGPIPREDVDVRIQRAVEHWEAHGFGIRTLREKTSGALVGHCGLIVNELGGVELIYSLTRDAWGRGLATEASSSVLAHAFGDLGLTEIAAMVFPENVASIRVLEKLGFAPAGTVDRFDAQLLLYRLGQWK